MKSDAFTTKRELDNLKQFVSNERSETVSQSRVSTRRKMSVGSEVFTNKHFNLRSIKGTAFHLHILPTYSEVKDEALNS